MGNRPSGMSPKQNKPWRMPAKAEVQIGSSSEKGEPVTGEDLREYIEELEAAWRGRAPRSHHTR